MLPNWTRLHGNLSITMALRVEIVDSLDSLLEPLAELLRTPTGALMMPELVAIPAIGVRLWLAEELARRLGTASATSSDGITTNIEFIFIGGLVARALGSRAAHDAWQVERLTFWVLQVIANVSHQDTFKIFRNRSLFDCYAP